MQPSLECLGRRDQSLLLLSTEWQGQNLNPACRWIFAHAATPTWPALLPQ